MILALDVGFKNLGWVLIDKGRIKSCGVIVTEKSKNKQCRVADDRAWRSAELAKELYNLIIDNSVKAVVAEAPSGGAQNARAMAYMNMGLAIVSSVCCILAIPIEWSTPQEGKKAMCGKNNASKEQMMNEAREQFPSPLYPIANVGRFEHIADAIGSYKALKNGNLVRQYG
jgi:Holliday junction resolvasome RuvABC endonuclease subunit